MPLLYKRNSDKSKITSGLMNSNSNASDLYEPGPGSNGGYVDVINDYMWTTSQLGQAAKDEIPYVYMTEFRYMRTGASLLYQSIQASQIVGIGNVVKPSDPYRSLYDFDSPTGFIYRLPFYTDTYYDVNNTFKDSDAAGALGAAGKGAGSIASDLASLKNNGGLLGKVGRMATRASIGMNAIGAVKDMLSGGAEIAQSMLNAAGGTGKLDVPKIWDTTAPRSITFSFYLFNTYDVLDIVDNWELVHLLRYQNTMNKLSLITAIPPVFYEVLIPGQHYSMGSYISNLQIASVGTTRLFTSRELGLENKNAQVHIPDAFKITITLADFLMPSQNLLTRLEGQDTFVQVYRRDKTKNTTDQQEQQDKQDLNDYFTGRIDEP
jgi:hypothetical protein